MTEGNTKFVMHNDSAEKLIGWMTMFAQVFRAMQMHEKADDLEVIRNNMQMQFHPVE